MRRLTARRWRNVCVTVVVAALILIFWWVCEATLLTGTLFSGWALAALFVMLAAYNLRKKLPFLPLGSSSAWLQAHLYAGWLTVVLFAVHIGFTVPNGWLESILALLYLGVAGSGIVGIMLSRAAAPRLTGHGEPVLFERLPMHYRQVRERAEELALESVATCDATTIADFHRARLLRFFRGPQHVAGHLVGSTRPRRKLLTDLDALGRYLDETERRLAAEIRDLIEVKDNLDFQYAVQGALKLWLFVHIPLTYALLIVTAVHIAIVYSVIGAAS